jgi:hypothetical protein
MTNSYNSAIITYETGGPLVVGIDLLFKQANNNIIKVIEKLDKSILGIYNDTIESFTFNSSKIFTILSEAEILRLYDNVPRLAKAQTIMGNRLMYGNYIEGYNLIDKYSNPTRLEYETELVTEEIGFQSLTTETWSGDDYLIDGGTGVYISNSALRVSLYGVQLLAGSSLTIELTFEGEVTGFVNFIPDQPPTSITFSFTLSIDYTSVYEMVTSVEFQNAIGTAFNILPVYSPIIGDETSCNGTTFTDSFNCSIQNIVTNSNTLVDYEKYESGITAPNQPIALLEVDPSNDYFSIQLVAMRYVDNPMSITDSVYAFFNITEHEAYFQKVSSNKSLHSNRDYEIGIVYMDEFNRATTTLVSPNNTNHIPCRFSVNKNSIIVNIPISQRAPSWAKRYKFVCKADAENYETIYTSIFFTQAGTSDVYFLLEGENMRKVEVGDRYIVKRDTNGPLLECSYATVLEKESKSSGFINTSTGVTPPAGVYMKMKPDGFQADQPSNAVINPGSITTNENNGGDYPIQYYPMNVYDGSSWVDYTVPAGSVIVMSFKFQRLGAGDGDNSCERRIYNLNVTLVSSANYDNMYDWWVGDNVASVLNSGTQEVGGTNCPINNVFQSGFGNPSTDICTNYFRFDRDSGTNQLWLKISGTQRCPGATGADKRRSSITTKITVFRADALMVFETLPTDTLPDVFFENELSFPIDSEGNHLSNGAVGDISQDISNEIPGRLDTGFFNCFTFGNGVESYKIRDSLIGRTFNLGERVTSVSAQDYKEARRFADITYSGVYNQETNVNKLNEFNLGLLDYKNLETSFGDIQILDGRETDVLVLQEDKISYVLAGKNLLSDAAAGSAITSVPEVLGTQIARTEKYGISFNPESYVHWGYDRFFTDIKRGAVIQLKGDSMSQDQLDVASELGMRTWFRDEFINSFNTQKLGGYDPYMNEYVLSTNDRELPGNPECLSCGISQTFNILTDEAVQVFEYCVDLKQQIGLTSINWTVFSISPGAEFEITALYNGTTYNSGFSSSSGTLDFDKDSIIENVVVITITATGSVSLSLNVGCPLEQNITIVEVVVTSDADSSKTIHTQYRYIDGGFIGPLQSSSVLFQSGVDPVVSRYNVSTGPIGSGSFPTDGSTLYIQTNKINPDTYNFNPLGNKFRYLRSNTNYTNTPSNISALLSASYLASPISGGPNIYQANFIVPPSIDGNYLYLIWDLRNSGISNLCYTEYPTTSTGLRDLCCNCSQCSESCIGVHFQNRSETENAEIYFPLGLCGTTDPITITLDPLEDSGMICVNNQEYYVVSGNVTAQLDECGCTPCLESCHQFIVWTDADNTATINYIDCVTGTPAVQVLSAGTSVQVCTPIGETVYVPTGLANINLTSACGCCESNCNTWTVVNISESALDFTMMGCDSVEYTYTVEASRTLNFCGRSGYVPSSIYNELQFTATSSCGCTEPYPCTQIQAIQTESASEMAAIPPVANFFPAVWQGTDWGTNGGINYFGRFINVNHLPSDPTGLNTGVSYYVTIQLSSAFPRDIGLWFGRLQTSLGGSPDLTLPANQLFIGAWLIWNPFAESGGTGVRGWFGKIGSNLPSGSGYNGTVTINVFVGSCG